MTARYGADIAMWPFVDEELYLQTFGPPKKGRWMVFGNNATPTGTPATQSYDAYAGGGSSQRSASGHDFGPIVSSLASRLLDELIARIDEGVARIAEAPREIIRDALVRMRDEGIFT